MIYLHVLLLHAHVRVLLLHIHVLLLYINVDVLLLHIYVHVLLLHVHVVLFLTTYSITCTCTIILKFYLFQTIFEFHSIFYASLGTPIFEEVAKTLAQAFEARCHKLYGPDHLKSRRTQHLNISHTNS